MVFKFTPQVDDDPRTAIGAAKASFVQDATPGGVAAIANPTGDDVTILRVLLVVETASGTAGTQVDVGVAADGVTLSDTLLDGAPVDAQGIVDNLDAPGTNGAGARTWAAGEYLTVSQSAGDVTNGLVGEVIVEYAR